MKFTSAMLITLTLLNGQNQLNGQDEANAGREQARETVLAHLHHRENLAKRQGVKDWEAIGENDLQLNDIERESLRKSFKDCHFFALRFRQIPEVKPPPKPFKSSNVMVVNDGRVIRISDEGELEEFFKKHLRVCDNKAVADATTRSWLRLAGELHQDGMFKFEEPTVEASQTASVGQMSVAQQNEDKGRLTVKMEFADGVLKSVKSEAKLNRGIRPRCQATRLLHEDPAIRDIMRRDLVVMGRTCKWYLDEVRADASPELRKAIDSVWQQILVRER